MIINGLQIVFALNYLLSNAKNPIVKDHPHAIFPTRLA